MEKDAIITEELLLAGGEDSDLLEKYMKEYFPFNELLKVGFFQKELKGNYYLQAKRVCQFFGYRTVFEYGATEIYCHLSFSNIKPNSNKPFITKIPHG